MICCGSHFQWIKGELDIATIQKWVGNNWGNQLLTALLLQKSEW